MGGMHKAGWLWQGAIVTALMVTVMGCATEKTRYPQCARYGFADCLQVDAAACDAMLGQAETVCRQRQGENLMYESMPERVQQDHLNRCMAAEVVIKSKLPEEEVKECLRW